VIVRMIEKIKMGVVTVGRPLLGETRR